MKARPPKSFTVKLTRAERNMVVRRRIFDAAVKIVGEFGYSEASIARITERSKLSVGALYNHFPTRQKLLDELLPAVGNDLLEFIGESVETSKPARDKETDRFVAFFAFLTETPEFVRILNEAAIFAPDGFKRHMANIALPYNRTLIRARASNQLQEFSDNEIEALVYMLLGIRSYLSSTYAYDNTGSVRQIPDYVISAYEKLIKHGIFKDVACGGDDAGTPDVDPPIKAAKE